MFYLFGQSLFSFLARDRQPLSLSGSSVVGENIWMKVNQISTDYRSLNAENLFFTMLQFRSKSKEFQYLFEKDTKH